jgi:hypothetical protein
MVRFGLAADPAQHEVDRRDELNFHRVRVQCVFAGRERRAPDTAMTGLNLFAVTKRFARSPVPLDCPTTQEARRIHSEMSRQLFTSLCHRTNFTWRIEFGLVTLRDERQAHHGRT